MSKIIVVPFGENATLRLRSDKIIATVAVPGSDHVDIYSEGISNPLHIYNCNADSLVNEVWGRY